MLTTEKILGVPSYDAREISEGSIYHVMYYGINYMGSYASQTSIEERWEITHYVEALRADLMGVARKPLVDGDASMMIQLLCYRRLQIHSRRKSCFSEEINDY